MPKKPPKRKTPEEIENYDSVNDPQVRIAEQLVQQLKPHLPIKCFKDVAEELGEVVVEKHRLPMKFFESYISEDLFPIESADDLAQMLSDGVRRTVALALSGSIPVGNKMLLKILTTFQEPEGRLPAHAGRIHGCATGSTTRKGDE